MRHTLKRLGQLLLAERQLADGPDLGILLTTHISPVHRPMGPGSKSQGGEAKRKRKRTGFRFFLISLSSEPPLTARMGAPSGSWAMGEPHSEQNQRQTALPDSATPFHFLMGPLEVNLSLGTTQTRAVG